MRPRDRTFRSSVAGPGRAGFLLALPLLALFGSAILVSVAGGRIEVSASLLPSPSLPVNIPTPSLPVALPTPSVPVTLHTPSLPIPTTPSPKPSPSQAAPGSGGGGGSSGSAGNGGGSGGGGGTTGGSGGGGVTIPFTSIVIPSPIDAALLSAVAVLPLLFAIWLFAFGRAWAEARRSREAQIRLAIAHDLGLPPRELTSVSTKALFKIREEAAFDEMTGVMRRAAGISALDREISRARRQKSPLAVAFVDVDGLKEANDKRGHKAGDDLIKTMAHTLQTALRGQDLVVRYGGDEFVCVLPDTQADAARAKLSWVQTEAEQSGLSFSVGVAELERSDDVVSLLGRADTEMYAVKARHHKIRDLRLGVVGGAPRPKTA